MVAKIEINEEKTNASIELNEEWDAGREADKLIGEMISIRKAGKVTQGQVAALTGNKQQIISRIEKRENSPSLKTFCNILNALGYELKIEKKQIKNLSEKEM